MTMVKGQTVTRIRDIWLGSGLGFVSIGLGPGSPWRQGYGQSMALLGVFIFLLVKGLAWALMKMHYL